MNDQWSGNTLLSASRAKWDAPSRSSIQRAVRSITPAAPEAWAYGFEIIALSYHIPFFVDAERKLGQRTGGGAGGRFGTLHHRKHRLMAGAKQFSRLRLIETDRTACVSAHFGEGDESFRRPIDGARKLRDFGRIESDQQCLRVGGARVTLREDRQHTVDLKTLGSNRFLVYGHRPGAGGPRSLIERAPGPGTQRADRKQGHQAQRRQRGPQHLGDEAS